MCVCVYVCVLTFKEAEALNSDFKQHSVPVHSLSMRVVKVDCCCKVRDSQGSKPPYHQPLCTPCAVHEIQLMQLRYKDEGGVKEGCGSGVGAVWVPCGSSVGAVWERCGSGVVVA